MKHLKRFSTHELHTRFLNTNIIKPCISYCNDMGDCYYEPVLNYFAFFCENNPIATISNYTVTDVDMSQIETLEGFNKSKDCPIDYVNGWNWNDYDSIINADGYATWLIVPSKYFDESTYEFIDDNNNNRYKMYIGPVSFNNTFDEEIKPMIYKTYQGINYTIMCINDNNNNGEQVFKTN